MDADEIAQIFRESREGMKAQKIEGCMDTEEIAREIEAAVDMSFPERVWYVLSRIDVEGRLKKKGSFSYLPWADAWEMIMEHYPESYFEFDDPKFFGNGTGEQWVTVVIKEKDQEFSRRWWLPYMNHKNAPVIDPSSLQINNTRMRVLVKCLAFVGLGTSVYSGEDVPDAETDSKPVRGTSARRAAMDGVELTDAQRAVASEWVDALREAMPNKDNINQERLVQLFYDTRKLGEVTIFIYDQLESWQRSAVMEIRKAIAEQERLAAVEKINAPD